MMKQIWDFHLNQNGAEAGLERILLVAFIALPLLALLIFFKDKIVTNSKEYFDQVFKNGTTGQNAIK